MDDLNASQQDIADIWKVNITFQNNKNQSIHNFFLIEFRIHKTTAFR